MFSELAKPLRHQPTRFHLPFLDGIRGIAILWVFAYHAMGSAYGWNHFPWKGLIRDFHEPTLLLLLFPINFGILGVAIFFVVSGFCIHISNSRTANRSWKYFYFRRFFRIYPAYLTALLVFIFIWPWHHFSPLAIIRQLFMHLLAIHNLDLSSKYSINPSFWSIGAEIQLYLIYPLLLLFVKFIGWKRTLFALLIVETLLHSLNLENDASRWHYALINSPFSYWFSWAIGAYLAELYLTGKTSAFSRLNFILILALSISTLVLRPLFSYSFTFFSFLTAIFIAKLIDQSWTLPSAMPLACKPLLRHLSFIGMISYSLYLVHQPIINSIPSFLFSHFRKESTNTGILLLSFSLYPIIVLISWFSFKFIEIPCIRLGNKLWKSTENA